MIVEAVAVAFGIGAAVGWVVNAIRTHRPSSKDISAYTELVISLRPDEADPLHQVGELTEKAQLVIFVTADTRTELQR